MKLKLFSAALAAALAVGALAACTPSTPAESEKTTLRMALNNSGGGFDVIQGIGSIPVAQAVYDSLVHLYTDGETTTIGAVGPWLAESWSYNDDRTVLTLNLRDDVDFTDGEHFDADAVKANLDLQLEGPSGPAFGAVDEFAVVDEYTIEVRLSEPDERVLRILSVPLASPAALDDREALFNTPVGSGPYTLESTVTDTEYVFVRNPDYWNAEAFEFDRIEMTVMEDLTARLNALKSGQIDYAQIDAATAAEAEATGLDTYVITPQWQGLILGDRRGEIVPALADVRVRQAIMMALDREAFNESAWGGLGDPGNQVGTTEQAGTGYYLPELADEYPYDPDRARELLAEAGYPDGFEIPPVQVLAGWVAPLRTYLTQALGDIGITVTFEENPDAFTAFSAGESPVFPFSGNFDEYAWLSVDGFGNPWHNTDAETEELLSIINVAEGEEWIEARSRLTEKILDEGWFAIIGHEPVVWAFDPSLKIEDVYPWPDWLGAIQHK
jgi:peptide/nickel transport system substrate-binding protein